MARAVKGLFHLIPVHNAPQVRAHRAVRVLSPLIIAVQGHLVHPLLHDGPRPRRQIVGERHLGEDAFDVVEGGGEALVTNFRKGLEGRQAGGAVDISPGVGFACKWKGQHICSTKFRGLTS